MLRTLIGLIVLTGLLLSWSCYPAYYPSKPNSPLLSGQGEAKVSASITPSSYEGQASYAITDHFALNANAGRVFYDSESPAQRTRGLQLEFTPGYYANFGKSSVVEVFGGYGFSSMHLEEPGNSQSALDYTMHKAFIQPAIGFRNPHFEGSFGLRLTAVSALELNANKLIGGTFVEPFGQLGFGGEKLKLGIGAGLSFPVTPIDIQYVPVFMSAGLQFRFGGQSGD